MPTSRERGRENVIGIIIGVPVSTAWVDDTF
jgi:hypothetical protein